ncbi:MAG: Wzz/FepE/Etk N-terminal domain-containing protein [Undibacterium sp.]
MELREIIRIFTQEKRLIAGLLLASVVIGFCVYRLQTQWYNATVLLTVTRTAAEDTVDYRYDQLYRLQADERMADTIARYLESGIGTELVAKGAGLDDTHADFFIKGKIQALRTSSQLIQVKYRTRTPVEAERISVSLLQTGERYTASLNEQARERNWFTLLASDTFVKDGRFTLLRTLLIAFALGALITFWTVIIRWYWYGDRRAVKL